MCVDRGEMGKKAVDKEKQEILRDFAKRVRQQRYSLGITQEQLAERAEMHVNYIGGIERALRNPSLVCLIALAKALNISPRDLIRE